MKVINGIVFDADKGFVEKSLYTDDMLISEKSVADDEVVDASGCYVIPGLVDVHFHGCLGEDFSEADVKGIKKIAEYELSQRVMYICPTTMTLPEKQLSNVCRNTAEYLKSCKTGSEIVGIHLEGPFVSKAKKGAQNEEYLHDPDFNMLIRLQKLSGGVVKLITVAPEEKGGIDFVKKATEAGVHVSVGHTVADYDTADAAFKAGADHATHLFNGMPQLHHRAPSVIGAISDNENVYPEIICDGIHIHGSAIRLAFKLFGKERMVLISDSLRATGMPDGIYPFGGQNIEVHGPRATIEGHPETLAGSVTSLYGCFKQAIGFGIPVEDAVRAASSNPAKSIGIYDRCGSLDTGKEASFLIVDKESLEIKAKVFKGKLI